MTFSDFTAGDSGSGADITNAGIGSAEMVVGVT
jgi:hypothetical protein